MSNTGKTYTEEFRRDAVELFQSSGRTATQVARELGVNVNSLRMWRNRILGQSGGESFGAVGDKVRAGASAKELLAEIKKLERENEYLRRQREILKKQPASSARTRSWACVDRSNAGRLFSHRTLRCLRSLTQRLLQKPSP